MKQITLALVFLIITACNAPVATEAIIVEPTSTEPVQATPEPATTTPTSVSATTTPPPLYFTDEFDLPSSYWQFLQTGGIDSPLQTSFETSTLQLSTSMTEAWYAGIYTGNKYSNVHISTKTLWTPSGSVGLICRYDEEDGWIEFNVTSDGVYSALYGHWLAPGIAEYRPVASNSSGQLTPATLDYEIGLSCKDEFIQLFVNGTSIRNLDISRFELGGGNIGVTVSSFGDVPMTAVFDWIKVSETE